MKSEYEVYVDYRRAKDVVAELRSIAQDTRRTADGELFNALRMIDANWDGENAEAFIAKGNKLHEKVLQTANNVEKIANAVESMAETTYKADMKAVQIARERGGRG